MKKNKVIILCIVFLLIITVVSVIQSNSIESPHTYTSAQSETIVSPTLYCLGACPTGPEGQTSISPGMPSPSSSIAPKENTPINNVADPCVDTASSTEGSTKAQTEQKKGWFNSFIEKFFELLDRLFSLLLQLFGQNPVTPPTSPSPTLAPTQTPPPQQAPTTTPCPTENPTPTLFGQPTSTLVVTAPVATNPPQTTQLPLPSQFKENKLGDYAWQPQPQKATIMIFHAHPDDEVGSFGSTLTYYPLVKKVPVVGIAMTNGGAGVKPEGRPLELANAYWEYGMRNPPIFAPFPDCCLGQSVDAGWQAWGGKDNAIKDITEIVRYFKPEVIIGHGFDGEYGHPNHITSAYSVAGACDAAGDATKYPEQVAKYGVWQVKKCYIHNYDKDRMTMDWTKPEAALNGKSPYDYTVIGIKKHASQGNLVPPRSNTYGLYKTVVGPDVAKNDFLENIPQ